MKLGLTFALALMLVPLSFAGKPYEAGMVSTYSTSAHPNSHYPADQPGCMHEDSQILRAWAGNLDPGQSFETTAWFCDYYSWETRLSCPGLLLPTTECPFGGPGGTGVAFEVFFDPRQRYRLTVSHPDGTVQEAHQLPDEDGMAHLQGCVVPYGYSLSQPTGNSLIPIAPGVYTITVTNLDTELPRGRAPEQALVGVWEDMAYTYEFQIPLCPEQDRRLVP